MQLPRKNPSLGSGLVPTLNLTKWTSYQIDDFCMFVFRVSCVSSVTSNASWRLMLPL